MSWSIEHWEKRAKTDDSLEYQIAAVLDKYVGGTGEELNTLPERLELVLERLLSQIEGLGGKAQ